MIMRTGRPTEKRCISLLEEIDIRACLGSGSTRARTDRLARRSRCIIFMDACPLATEGGRRPLAEPQFH